MKKTGLINHTLRLRHRGAENGSRNQTSKAFDHGEDNIGVSSLAYPSDKQHPAANTVSSRPSRKRGISVTGSLLANYAVGLAAVGMVVMAGSLFGRLAAAPPSEVEIGGYATSLVGRTSSQRHNARLSAEDLNGKVIPPGKEFSFNQAVKSWSMDRGYVKAPVSFDGELVRAFGGGVCQTSTTLYNAALLAGLPIEERHSHVFVAHYVPPGQDAAVAFPGIDLRFRNPYPWPIRIRTRTFNDRLEVRLFGAEKPKRKVEITEDILSVTEPERMTRSVSVGGGHNYIRNPGSQGCRVVTYRLTSGEKGSVQRERLSDDTYQAMNRIIRLDESQ
jgi:vancomycin resistance protein VanW